MSKYISLGAAVLTILGAVVGALFGVISWDTALLSITAGVSVLGIHPNLPQ